MNHTLWWQLAGWTMLHFLWLGTAIGLVIAVLRLLLRRAAANVRYGATLVGFALLAGAPLAIAGWLWSYGEWTPPVATAPAMTGPVAVAEVTAVELAAEPMELPYQVPTASSGDAFAESLAIEPEATEQQVIDLKYNPITLPEEGTDQGRVVQLPVEQTSGEPMIQQQVIQQPTIVEWQPIEGSPPPVAAEASPAANRQAKGTVVPAMESVIRTLPWLWVIGTPVMLVLLATGLVGSDRLRRRAEVLVDGPLREAADRLQTALRIGQRVTVAVSDRVVQPVLVGVVRPLILLPAAVSGWSPEQIEMALVHELAHVRRCDNLVNLVQRLIEAVLFFHPVVWMVSRALRHDREQCCDALVVAHTGAPEAYADLLLSVARQSAGRRLPMPALAMASHPLTRRVRRILQMEDDPMLISKRTFGLAVALAGIVAVALWQGQPLSVAEEAVSEPAVVAAGEEPVEVTTEDAEGTEEGEMPIAIGWFHFPNQRQSDPSYDSERNAWLDEQAREITTSESLRQCLEWLAEHHPDDADLKKLNLKWLQQHLSANHKEHFDVSIGLQRDPELPLSREQSAEVVRAVVECYVARHYDSSDPEYVRVHFHSGLSEQELEERNQLLREHHKNMHARIARTEQGNTLSLEFTPKICVSSEILVVKDTVIAYGALPKVLYDRAVAEDQQASPKVVAELWFDPSAEQRIFPNPQVETIWRATQVELAKSHRVLDRAMTTLLERSKTNSDTPRVTESWLLENLVVDFNKAGDIGFRLTSSEHSEEALDQILHAVADSYFVQTNNKQSVAAITSEASADDAPTPDTNFSGTSKTYHFTIDTPMSEIAPVIAAHERAGHQVKISNAGNEVLVVVTHELRGVTPYPTYHFKIDTPMSEIAPVIAAHERAGHQVKISNAGNEVLVVVTRPAAEDSPQVNSKLPFLPLEDQRIVDLAFNLFDMEVSDLDEEQLKVAKQHGLTGGVLIEGIPQHEMSSSTAKQAGLKNGDILVGLHVWSTANLDELGMVLRRDDLYEFNPLKFFVLRNVAADEKSSRKEPGGRAIIGVGGNSDAGLEGEVVLDEPVAKWELFTGRINYGDKAWREEQIRLQEKEKAEQEQQAEDYDGPVYTRVAPEISVPTDTLEQERERAREGYIDSQTPRLLYDGRTFDDWRDEWKTELKTENRTEAIKALRAFGRAGKGKEATEAILEVAEEYSFALWYPRSNQESSTQQLLVSSIVWSFVDQNDSNPISIDVAMPVILEWYRKNPEQHVDLTRIVLFSTASKSPATLDLVASLIDADDKRLQKEALQHLVNADRKLENERTLTAIRTHLKSDDDEVVINALRLLNYYANMRTVGSGDWGQNLVRVEPLMVPCLFHPSLEVRQAARTSLNKGNEEQLRPIVELLAEIIREPRTNHQWQGVTPYTIKSEQQMPEIRLAAIRALAAMGENAAPAVDSLKPWLAADDEPELQTASRAALCSAFGAMGDLQRGSNVEPSKLPDPWRTSLLEGCNAIWEDGNWNQEKYEELKVELRVEASKLLHPSSMMGGGFGGGGGLGGGGVF